MSSYVKMSTMLAYLHLITSKSTFACLSKSHRPKIRRPLGLIMLLGNCAEYFSLFPFSNAPFTYFSQTHQFTTSLPCHPFIQDISDLPLFILFILHTGFTIQPNPTARVWMDVIHQITMRGGSIQEPPNIIIWIYITDSPATA